MRLLICDDQAIIRDGLTMLLNLEKDMEIVGSARDGGEAITLAATLQPDLILMDLKMPHINGIDATRQILQQHPKIKILVLTTYDADEWVFDAIRAGAVGYLLKDTPREELLAAIRGTFAGKTYLDPTVAGKILQQAINVQTLPTTQITTKLTDREVEVLHLVAQGMSNSDIASHLFLSEGTVRNHVSAILTKLDVTDRTQAAIIAIQHGLG